MNITNRKFNYFHWNVNMNTSDHVDERTDKIGWGGGGGGGRGTILYTLVPEAGRRDVRCADLIYP
jgi:hypothetical protein